MLKRTIMGAVLAIASAVGMLFVTAGSAQAADCYCSYASGTVVGEVTFVDDDDRFYVWDTYADGHGVRGYLLNANFKQLATAYDGSGADSTIASFHYDVKDGVDYWLRVCTVDGASDTTGSSCSTYGFWE